MKLRRLIFLKQTTADLVILDSEGSEHIVSLLPSDVNFVVLPVRSEIPMIFTVAFLINLAKLSFHYLSIRQALLGSLLLTLKPKVLITYIDNNRWAGVCKSLVPSLRVISIQNGMRYDLMEKCEPTYDVYFTFGVFERDILKHHKARYTELISVGSLRAGYAISRRSSRLRTNPYLCLISDLVLPENFKSINRADRDLFIHLNESLKKIALLLLRYGRENSTPVRVAMRTMQESAEYVVEADFYRSLGYRSDELLGKKDHFTSYDSVIDSSISIGILSTLLFEAFGMGVKSLFCIGLPGIHENLQTRSPQLSQFKERLPPLVSFDNAEYAALSVKISKLNKMSAVEYEHETDDARKYYMDIDYSNLPQSVISDYIGRYLRPSCLT